MATLSFTRRGLICTAGIAAGTLAMPAIGRADNVAIEFNFPVAVARDQLPFAVAELSTHDNQRVTQVLDDQLQAALLGHTAAKPALETAQATAARLLKPFVKG